MIPDMEQIRKQALRGLEGVDGDSMLDKLEQKVTNVLIRFAIEIPVCNYGDSYSYYRALKNYRAYNDLLYNAYDLFQDQTKQNHLVNFISNIASSFISDRWDKRVKTRFDNIGEDEPDFDDTYYEDEDDEESDDDEE